MTGGNHIARRWLIGFRWGAVGGKLSVVLVAQLALGASLPPPAVFALIALEALSNLWLTWVARRRAHLPPHLVLGLMTLDVLTLTALLHLTGGASNPFSVVYLIYLTLAAVSLPGRWTWGLAGLAALCFGSLFAAPADMHHGPHEMARHLHGMWVAFIVAAFFIVFFVNLLRRELAAQQSRLDRTRRLATVTTLAAGAAHELSTPLGTIAVAASELRHELADASEEVREDLELIRQQVERCRQLLSDLRERTGTITGEAPRPIALAQLLAPVVAQHAQLKLQIDAKAAEPLMLPLVAMRQVLSSLVKNAVEASGPGASVDLSARREQDRLIVRVRDEGSGMSEEVLERARDPFFTTKGVGEGVGLGLFLAEAVAEQLGGTLVIASKAGSGTTATLDIPLIRSEEGEPQ